MAAPVELAFDRLQDFAVERIHDVMHHDTDDARPRRPEAGRTAVVDIAEGACLFLDLFPRIGRNQRTVAQGERYGCGGQSERFGNR